MNSSELFMIELIDVKKIKVIHKLNISYEKKFLSASLSVKLSLVISFGIHDMCYIIHNKITVKKIENQIPTRSNS